MQHPDLLLDLARFEQQDRLRQAETWRLARAARQGRARYGGRLLHHLVLAARQCLKAQARPKPAVAAER